MLCLHRSRSSRGDARPPTPIERAGHFPAGASKTRSVVREVLQIAPCFGIHEGILSKVSTCSIVRTVRVHGGKYCCAIHWFSRRRISRAAQCLSILRYWQRQTINVRSPSRAVSPAMSNDANLTSTTLRTPKAAAVAGILFSILTIAIFWLLRSSFPLPPLSALARLDKSAPAIAMAIYLVPFAGVAFLWFIGVLRNRLGRHEDQFFATVFLGSGLLFLAMLFTAAAIVGAILVAFATTTDQSINPETFAFVRSLAFILMNVFATKMAAVFMISASIVVARTRIGPRYLSHLGVPAGIFILVASQSVDWAFLVFPFWILLFSTQILIDNFRRPSELSSGSS